MDDGENLNQFRDDLNYTSKSQCPTHSRIHAGNTLIHNTIPIETTLETLSLCQPQLGHDTLSIQPPPSISPASSVTFSTTSSSDQAQSLPLTKEEILEKRKRFLGPNMALFFQEDPLHIVRGEGSRLFDPEGTSYLDCINNVSHVGHCHPRVAAAASQQLFALNTNSRYLHENLVNFAERLVQLMPSPLQVVYPVVSGSEANDLAWRIACQVASAHAAHDQIQSPGNASLDSLHVAVMDYAYHGHSNFCIDISPYKFDGPGGSGRRAHVHVLPCPDPYRGLNMDGRGAARAAIQAAEAAGGRIAAFYAESIISCGGQVILPPGYLRAVYAEMRGHGAVCIADEVQCGFGRVGSHFWAFELQQVVPDIVTIGKPMGNGYPMAAVVTTPAIANTFANGMEFFATYGGSTAAATVGIAVLDVIRDENLLEHAMTVGEYIKRKLRNLKESYPDIVGDVRGEGLMIGIEMVTDAVSKTPSADAAKHVKNRCKEVHRVLLSSEGPYANIIKIKPPMCFSKKDGDVMVMAIAESLATLQRGVL